MPIYTLQRTQVVPMTLEKCWAFFADPRNLEKITPPKLSLHVKSPLGPFGALLNALLIRGQLERIFDFRTRALGITSRKPCSDSFA